MTAVLKRIYAYFAFLWIFFNGKAPSRAAKLQATEELQYTQTDWGIFLEATPRDANGIQAVLPNFGVTFKLTHVLFCQERSCVPLAWQTIPNVNYTLADYPITTTEEELVSPDFQNVPAKVLVQSTTLPNNLKFSMRTHFFARDTYRNYYGYRLDVAGRGAKINLEWENLQLPSPSLKYVGLYASLEIEYIPDFSLALAPFDAIHTNISTIADPAAPPTREPILNWIVNFIDKRLSLSVHWLDEAEHFYDDEVESFPCSSFQLFPGEDESWIPAVLATLADTTTTSKKLTVPIQVSFDGIIRPNITKISWDPNVNLGLLFISSAPEDSLTNTVAIAVGISVASVAVIGIILASLFIIKFRKVARPFADRKTRKNTDLRSTTPTEMTSPEWNRVTRPAVA